MATDTKHTTATKTPRAARSTPPAARVRGRLDDEQVAEVLELLRGVDSVELKISVPDADRRPAIAALGIDPLDAQIRQVVFFDTPELSLDAAGVVVRARRVQGKTGDSVVKLRPFDPATAPAALRKSPAFGIELDAMPTGYVCSGSMKASLDNDLVKEVVSGRRPIRKLFTKEQRDLFASHAPPDIALDDLRVLGPVNVLKLKFTPPDLEQRMVAELWFYPGGDRILELSTKCPPSRAFDVAARARVFLASQGIDLLAEQQTKTRTALDFFARELTVPSSP